MARFNKVTNPVTRLFVAWVPGYAVVHHLGRVSGRAYRTPVKVYRRPGGYTIAIPLPAAGPGLTAPWARPAGCHGAIPSQEQASVTTDMLVASGIDPERLAAAGGKAGLYMAIMDDIFERKSTADGMKIQSDDPDAIARIRAHLHQLVRMMNS